MAKAPFEHGKYIAVVGDVLGDNARGITPSRRFVQQLDDGTFTVITEYASAVIVNPEETPRVYDVENMTEVMHCRSLDDVGGTEIGCGEYEREYINYVGFSTLRGAESFARRYIRSLDISHYGWEEVLPA